MAIKIKNLDFSYSDSKKNLVDINLNINAGKKTAVLGMNGSGKSTLLYHLNGIIPIQSGSIEVLGMMMEKRNLSNIRRQVGFLFDFPDHQLFSTTVYRDIRFGLDNYNYPKELKDQLINEVARGLRIEDLLDSSPHQLSLGQKKRVAIAGLMVLEPSIIVCDEPFSGLDGSALSYFKGLLDEWIDQGKTIIFSTHDVDLAYEWSDDLVIMKGGEILAAKPTSQLLTDNDIYSKSGLVKPMLYELFQDRDVKPRSLEDAKKYLND